MVFVHGTHPLADGCASFGHFGYSCWLKFLAVNIWLDGFNHSICNVVLEEVIKIKVKRLVQLERLVSIAKSIQVSATASFMYSFMSSL